MSKFVITATWDDVPHLSREAKEELLKEIPAYQRDARTKGVPQLGAGAVFPIAEDDIKVDDFFVPAHWPRGYSMDVGWKKTAGLWGAKDVQNNVVYLYSEYYRGHAEPEVHAAGFKDRGSWMEGVIDPAANGRSQHDGKKLRAEYEKLGLNLHNAKNAVEAGIFSAFQLMTTGRLKVFRSMSNFFMEMRTFQRDTNGKIVDDHKYHLMACLRYFVNNGMDYMKIKPGKPKQINQTFTSGSYGGGWMQG